MPRRARSVIDDLAGGGLVETHDGLGQGGLAAAVGAGDHQEGAVLDVQGHILQNLLLTALSLHREGQMFQFQHSANLPFEAVPRGRDGL